MDGIRSAIAQFWADAPLVPVFDRDINLYWLIAAGVAVVCLLVCYILQSRALQRLSYDRWLSGSVWAWFPVGGWYVLGSIADDYAQKARGKRRHKRRWLLWLSVASGLVAGALTVCLLGGFGYIAIPWVSAQVLFFVAQILVLVLGALWLVRLIFGILALLAVYTSCDPDRAVANLVVSILLPITLPFILFACRNRNFGMPPEKMHMAISNTWKPHT